MRSQAVRDPAGPYAGVPAGENVRVRIADHDRLPWRGPCIAHQLDDANRVRLLLLEAVASVHESKVIGELESGEDGAAKGHRFVGQDRERSVIEFFQGFTDAIVSDRMVK